MHLSVIFFNVTYHIQLKARQSISHLISFCIQRHTTQRHILARHCPPSPPIASHSLSVSGPTQPITGSQTIRRFHRSIHYAAHLPHITIRHPAHYRPSHRPSPSPATHHHSALLITVHHHSSHGPSHWYNTGDHGRGGGVQGKINRCWESGGILSHAFSSLSFSRAFTKTSHPYTKT